MTSYLRTLFVALLGFCLVQSCAVGDPEGIERPEQIVLAQILECFTKGSDGKQCSYTKGVYGICQSGQCVPECKVLRDGQSCSGDSGVCLDGACCTGCILKAQCIANGTDNGKSKYCGVYGKECSICEDDGNPCTDEICGSRGECLHVPKADGVSCESDGDVCNGTSACYKGECVPGKPLDCTSTNPCVTASCDKAKGCVTQNNSNACNDGNPCTVNDQCSDGICKGGSAVNCDDNNPCTADSCDAARGCVHTPLPATELCDDRNGCTTNDHCDGNGKCVGEGSVVCEDPNPCTINGCANNICDFTQLEAPGTPCTNSANKCLVNTTCNSDGECAGGTPKDCNDNNPCTQDSCDPETGECTSTPLSAGGCSDDSACTTNDHCEDGTCVGEPIECAAIDDCHVAGSCEAATGLCNDPRRENGAECASGTGTCSNGACVPKPVDEGDGGAGNEEPSGGAPSSEGGSGGTSEEDGGTGGASESTADAGEGGSRDAAPEGGAANSSSGTTGNRAGKDTEDETANAARGKPFVRKGGGCATSSGDETPSSFAVFALLGAAAFMGRRSRSVYKGARAASSK